MVTLDWMAGVYEDLTIYNFDGKEIQRPRRWTSNNFSLGIEERAMARAVKLMFIFPPGNCTTEVGAAVP